MACSTLATRPPGRLGQAALLNRGARSAPTVACSGGVRWQRRPWRQQDWQGQASLGNRFLAPARSPAAMRIVAAAAAAAAAASSAPSSSAQGQAGGPVLLWFKQDLRLDDHPGLHQALASGAPLLPVFCFDPAQYAHLLAMPGGIQGLVRAVRSLQRSLQALGSDLLVLRGPWDSELPRLAAHAGASAVLAEAEVDWGAAAALAAVEAALPGGTALRAWRAPLLAEFVDNFRELKRRRPAANPPLDPPAALPRAPTELLEGWGEGQAPLWGEGALPAEEELEHDAAVTYQASLDPLLAAALSGPEAAASPDWLRGGDSGSSVDDGEERAAGVIGRIDPADSTAPVGAPERGPGTQAGAAAAAAWEAELAAELAAGEGPVMEALEAYLREVESDMGVGGSELAARLGAAVARFDVPAAPEGCFPALFTRALVLGVVSKRRLYHTAQVLLRSPAAAGQEGPLAGLAALLAKLAPAGWAQGAGASRARKAAAAAAAAEAKDFHEQMAAGRQGRVVNGAELRHWRWRGLLTDYLVAAPPAGAPSRPGAPALLLVHGFGAFSEQWRDNVAALAAAGYHVYAPTLPGYGRAEKPSLPYGQGLWTEFLHDFVLQAVRRPVVAVGNSIGGFMSASLAADYPGLCQGLILLNSAGLLVKDYVLPTQPPTASPPPRFVANAVSQGLLDFVDSSPDALFMVLFLLALAAAGHTATAAAGEGPRGWRGGRGGWAQAQGLFAFLESSVENQLKRLYPVRPERADAWLAGEIARAACDPGALGVFRSVFYLPRPRPLSYLVAQVFRGPTLVLQGGKDPLNDAVGRAQQLQELCPNVQVVMLDAGHCPHDEVPEQANAQILHFVEEQVLPQQAKQRGAAQQEAVPVEPQRA